MCRMTAKSTSIMSGSMKDDAGVAILRPGTADAMSPERQVPDGQLANSLKSTARWTRGCSQEHACTCPVLSLLGPVIPLSDHHVGATDKVHVGSWPPTAMRSFCTRF